MGTLTLHFCQLWVSVRNLKNIFIILFQIGFISLEFLLYNLIFKTDAIMHSEVFHFFFLPSFPSNSLLLPLPKIQTDIWMVVNWFGICGYGSEASSISHLSNPGHYSVTAKKPLSRSVLKENQLPILILI